MNQNEILQAVRENPELAERAREQMQSVLTRSATDAEFRQLLLSDSRAALSTHFGRQIPESVNITFVENRAAATIVLPDAVAPGMELSEAELETVAGGSVGVLEFTAMVVLAAVMIVDAVN